MNIQTVAGLDDKMPIASISGVIEAVYKQKTGTNDKGPWTVQDIRLSDSTGEIYVSVWDYAGDLEKLTGKSVELKSKKSTRGFSGLYVEEKNGKKKLKLTHSGSIILSDSAPAGESRVEYDNQGARQAKEATPKAKLFQMSQCYVDCIGAAKFVRKQALSQHEVAITPEQFQALCASLFIAADKNRMWQSYPTHPPKDETTNE